MERNQKTDQPKGKIYSGGGGAPEDNDKQTYWQYLFFMFWILAILGAVFHFILLLAYLPTSEIDGLDYCKFTYGKGWKIYPLTETSYICQFIQENGSDKVISITTMDVESRHCEKKFYNPSYCGRKDGRDNS